VGKDFFETGAGNTGAFGQILNATVAEQTALVDDQHSVGDGFDIADDMGAEEDGAIFSQRAQRVAEGQHLHGVEAVRWLVEQQDRRVVHQRGRQADALAETSGALFDALFEHGVEAAKIDCLS
jgi:hypothetical protein